MALNGLVYGDFEGNYSFQSLAGDNITLERPSKDIPFVKLNGEYVLPFSFESEILFKDGVAFPINQVVFPKNLTIGVQQLIETVHAKEFLSILEAVNLTGLISDTEYSFLVPSSATLKMSNITSFSREPDFLREFALMHILPENSMQKIINCEPIIPTLLNNTHLTCHRIASGGLMLQILEGNDRSKTLKSFFLIVRSSTRRRSPRKTSRSRKTQTGTGFLRSRKSRSRQCVSTFWQSSQTLS